MCVHTYADFGVIFVVETNFEPTKVGTIKELFQVVLLPYQTPIYSDQIGTIGEVECSKKYVFALH